MNSEVPRETFREAVPAPVDPVTATPVQPTPVSDPVAQHVDPSGPIDVASVLGKIQALEQEKLQLANELKTKDAKLSKLTEGKRLEMQQTLDSVIKKWLTELEVKNDVNKVRAVHGFPYYSSVFPYEYNIYM